MALNLCASDKEGAMVSLNIKCSTGTKLKVTAKLDKSVCELKAQFQADVRVGVPRAPQQT